MHSIWSYYLDVINANAASFHPCILVDTLMTYTIILFNKTPAADGSGYVIEQSSL